MAAATGDNLASFDAVATAGIPACASGVGVGLAYDPTSTSLILSCWESNVLQRVNAVTHLDNGPLTISGLPIGNTLGALAYDGGRNRLWACNSYNSGTQEVVLIDLTTSAVDTSVTPFVVPGCFDGLAYDASDDTIWVSADAAYTVNHYSTAGVLLGSYPVNLGGDGNSGIAVGGPLLYLANDGGSQIYSVPKDFSTAPTLFASFPARLEDLECDSQTFAGSAFGAIWSIDAYNRVLNAWEIPAGACTSGGGGGSSNTPPTAAANGPYSGNEGAAISISGTASDTDGDTVTTSWSASGGPGTCSFGDATALSTTVTCTDEGTYKLTLTANDGTNPPVTSDATLTVSNVKPAVSITAPLFDSLYAINTSVNLTAPFTDAGVADAHSCTIDWGAGAGPVAGTVAETVGSGSGTCSGTSSYTAAGVHPITVSVTDGDGADGTGTAASEVVIYDPSAGFVTGGGWINSPAGAYVADASLAGKANFGFVSKYQKGATVPTGSTEFQFQAGNLDFHSSSYQWLVVNQGGTNAQFKGTGTINGAGTYGFMLWAGDGSPDTFRIQITDASNNVVYDNGVQQALGGGSIVIHK